MKNALEREVFAAVQASQPLTEAAINDALKAKGAPEPHPEMLGASLRRLIGAGYITRVDNAYRVLTSQGDSPAPAPAPAPIKPKEPMVAKMLNCKGCGEDKPESAFYASNKSRCKRCILDSQRAAKASVKAGGGPTLTGKARAKKSGAVKSVPMSLATGSMVSRQFTLTITDVAGKKHALIVPQHTVQQLATELQEFL